MPQQTNTLGNNIDNHIVEEFIIEYNDAHSEIESLLLVLENNPDDSELLNKLFRQVHSIKGNSHFLGLDLIANFVHALETVLDKVRKREMTFDKLLSDVVLQVVDHIGYLCNNARKQQSVDISLTSAVQKALTDLAAAPQHETSNIIYRILGLLGKDIATLVEINNMLTNEPHKVNLTSQQLEDLKFYAGIIESAEQRSPYWIGRSQRLLNIALELNNVGDGKIDPAQLEAAVYLHDFGMAFLPLEILHKSESLTENELQAIKLHPNMGAALLSDNPHWQVATEIVLQHHEREDGNGYPQGLSGDQICDGAKILAIADAFESMTTQRANRSNKHTITFAITEINNNSGTQFSSFWVSVFNKVIRNKTRKK